jgi:hypothetical protein
MGLLLYFLYAFIQSILANRYLLDYGDELTFSVVITMILAPFVSIWILGKTFVFCSTWLVTGRRPQFGK